jgi:hypothetical protein
MAVPEQQPGALEARVEDHQERGGHGDNKGDKKRVLAGLSRWQESGVCVFMMMILLLFLQKQNLASAIYLFGLGTRLSGVSCLTVNPSQCPFVQMTDTDVAFLLYYRSCPCDRHDHYLPSIPASSPDPGQV